MPKVTANDQNDLIWLAFNAATAPLSHFKSAVEVQPNAAVLCDKRGDHLIHHVVFDGKTSALRYLLDSGFPATTPGERGCTPLHYAAGEGRADMAKLLLKHVADVSPVNQNGITPLHVAAGQGEVEILNMLIHRGATVHAIDKFGCLPVHYAAGAGRLPVMKILAALDHQSLETADHFGMRPLHWACYFEYPHVAAWLLRQGVKKTPRDIYGRSPGFFARLSGRLNMRELSAQLPVRGKGGYGCPEAHHAILHGPRSRIREVLKGAIECNQTDGLGRTLLHCAAFARDRDTFKQLQRRGCLAEDARDQYGWNAIRLLNYRMMPTRKSCAAYRSRLRKKVNSI